MDQITPDNLRENIASIEGMIRNFSIDLNTKKELKGFLVSTLALKTECLEILCSKNTKIVILKEYGDVRKEVKELRERLKKTQADLKVFGQRLLDFKLEHQKAVRALKKMESSVSGEQCGKLLEFRRTKTPTGS